MLNLEILKKQHICILKCIHINDLFSNKMKPLFISGEILLLKFSFGNLQGSTDKSKGNTLLQYKISPIEGAVNVVGVFDVEIVAIMNIISDYLKISICLFSV